jgi:hypothetical protein
MPPASGLGYDGAQWLSRSAAHASPTGREEREEQRRYAHGTDTARDCGSRVATLARQPLDRRRAALVAARAAVLSCSAPSHSRGVHAGAGAASHDALPPPLLPPQRSSQTAIDLRAIHAVHTAIGCNVAILGAKLGVYALSGSSSILAESIHSLADIANQARQTLAPMSPTAAAAAQRAHAACKRSTRAHLMCVRADAAAHGHPAQCQGAGRTQQLWVRAHSTATPRA